MEKQTGIWIDSSKAIIVKLLDGKESTIEIQSEIENRVHHLGEGDKGTFTGIRHSNNEKKFDERKQHQINSFLKNVIEQIKSDNELYIFGPAEIKLKLKTLIEEDKHLLSKLKSVETADSMTNNQVVARVKDFFKD
ncbi:MAG: hypothetical protein IPO27_04670 [Bacteroidetes bacterium]|nr:hypothetical protein [Bacteroidota bacterium]